MSWLVLALLVPIVVAWNDGTTYTFALSLTGVGVAMYFLNVVLIRSYISKNAPLTVVLDTWEETSGKGVVPKWVSVLGLVGTGFIPSGLLVTLFLYLGVFIDRA